MAGPAALAALDVASTTTGKIIHGNPCAEIKLSQVVRGLTRAPKWMPEEAGVLRLFDVVPTGTALWCGSGPARAADQRGVRL